LETLVHKPTNRAVTVQPAASRCVQRKAVQTRFSPRVQTSLKISSPKDPAEKEADVTAKRILHMTIPDNTVGRMCAGGGNRIFGQLRAEGKKKRLQRSLQSPYIIRFAGSGIPQRNIFRKAEGQPDISSNLAADIQSSMSSGSPLPLSTRAFMEPRFRTDFSKVRIHTGEKAAKLNRQLNAHAFTVSDHIFFGRDKFRPETSDGKELIAHELTHTIQQGAAVQRKEDVTVTQRSQPMVQRGIVSEVLDYFADKAYNIPGFRMFTIVIGFNPINMEKADRSAANILRAIVEFLPGGHLIVEALENHGVFQKVGAWVEQQFATLASIGAEFKASLDAFIDSLGWRDVFRLGSVWNRAKALFTNPVNRLINFAKGLFTGIIKFIKDAILRPLAKLAEGTRGYDLLKAVLGEDPITGDPVPQTADTLIGGFMKLIGQEEIWENIKKANAIPRAWAWFKNALSGLMGLVRSIPGRFIAVFQSLTIWDIVLLPKAFAKIIGVFVGIAGDFISWAGGTIWSLLEIIFSVLAPAVMPYLKKAAAAFRTILKNPIGFVGNLVRAAKQGFMQFAGRFLTHLKNSLIQWLTGALPGVYIPQALNLREIIKFVLSVLGLTWANIRAKLVKAVGETAVKAMETGFDIVVTLVTQGPAAAWDKIKEALANLQAMVIDAVMDFVKSKVVEAAVTKLLSMLSPAGAFIQAIIAIYNTVMFFIERLRQIAQVAMSFIDSIAAIAGGVIAAAANKVETTMAGLLTLVISFLARIAGLGKVSDAVMNVINKVRVPIDRGLDLVVNWVVTTAKRIFLPTRAGEPDNEVSKELKKKLKAELSGKKITDSEQGAALISSLYSKYSAKGLKGMRVIYDAKTKTAGIKVSASIPEVIANLPVDPSGLKQVLTYAREFHFMNSDTVLYIFYDLDNKPYDGPIRNASRNEHAEQVFKNKKLQGLWSQIQAERNAGKLKTPAGKPVRVELNLNRIPCPICSPILATLSGMYPDITFVVKASSASNKVSAVITAEYIETMLAAGVEVSTLKVFEAIKNKIVEILRRSQAKEVALTSNDFDELQVVIMKLDENLSKERLLQEMINQAVQNRQKKKALGEIPPVGSGT
jgi:hypothetical protein